MNFFSYFLYLPVLVIIPPQNECFRRYTGITLSVRLSVRPFTNTSFCQSAGWGIKSLLVKALVTIAMNRLSINRDRVLQLK